MIGIGIGLRRQRFSGGFADSYSSRVLADGGTIEALTCVANASTLLQQASLLFIPSGYKAGVAYSALPNNGIGDLTWSRNSTANRTNSNGNIGSVGANVPRLSYMYGSCPSALLEPQRTNLLLRSEEFDNASWNKSRTTISANATTSPNNTSTADKLVEDTNTGSHDIEQAVSMTSGLSYTASVYAKRSENRYIVLRFLSGGAFSTNYIATFDLLNGSASNSANFPVSSFSITNVGNGWYRCTITQSASATGSGNFGMYMSKDGTQTSYTGNRTDGLFIWGAQLEQGAYPTTYIPTTNATATRLADIFTRNNIYTNGLIGGSGGTWYVELKNNVSYTRDTIGALWIGDNSTSSTLGNAFNIRSGGTGRLPIGKTVGGVFTSLYTTLTDNVKIAIKWNGTTADVFVNGVKVVSATAFTATNMEFLYGQGSDVPKFIQAMALFNTPLSDSDCITLTT